MSCSSRAEAEEWANAIRNNVAALPQEAPTGKIGGANGYAGLNGMVNNAMAMKNTMVNPTLLLFSPFEHILFSSHQFVLMLL